MFNDFLLTSFLTQGCGHCKKAKPEYKLAAEKFKDDSKVEFAAVDCTAESSICSAANVSGYPTIIYYQYYNKDNPVPYSGDRTSRDFIRFMEDRRRKSSDESYSEQMDSLPQLSKNSFQSNLISHDFTLVQFVIPDCLECKKFSPEFEEASRLVAAGSFSARVALATVNCQIEKDLCDQHHINSFPTIRLFKGLNFVKDFKGDKTSNTVVQFLKKLTSEKRDEL
ncbi:hypothetical protein J437_LFUL012463 [Ladona fulva]|uniref:Thioredoxin domain-containing protein n=1 Tax=Ladona fulva TaxID=123851 RepID=A0A8K0K1L9_LADFU|nr:hypothetical protein J437_LFUL012463 [Ladona fulva]